MAKKKSPSRGGPPGIRRSPSSQNPGTEIIPVWELAPPTIEYHAQSAMLRVEGGSPVLYFIQFRPGQDEVMNGVAVSMPPLKFVETMKSYEAVAQRMPDYLSWSSWTAR